jgi:putative peptidoglycan lipid II flippase
MSRLFRTSLLLAFFFGLDKIVAVLRQLIIARQFGLSNELDAFNVANNLPDLLFALISGGALAIAFIPVLSEVLSKDGRPAAWDLFARIANLAFLVTAALAVVVAIAAGPLVRAEVGIAPGFERPQQDLVAELMRLNLIATMIFSVSGLVMAGLQANQHFLLPAMAPLMYNIGQIFGATVLAPETGYSLGGITLPAMGLGVHGLVYGVILGAALHLGIQIPGLLRYKFRWAPAIGINTEPVRKVLRLMVPRLGTMLFIQATFLVRDNLASRLESGAVSALTYGYMIMQVPETLIGTAIGTALLPTLSEQAARQDHELFHATVERAVRVLIAITLPVAVVLSAGLRPLIELGFGFDAQGTELMLWVARGFLAGLIGQSVMEVAARSFYARQNALVPLMTAGINAALYTLMGVLLFRRLGAPGISLADSLAFSIQALLLILLLNRRMSRPVQVGGTLLRAVLAGAASAAVITLVINGLAGRIPVLFSSTAAMGLGALVALPFIWKEIRLLLRL